MSIEVTGLRLLTVRELADATGIPKWRLYEMLAQGKAPPHLRISRTIRFPADDVVRWIKRSSCTRRNSDDAH